MILHADTSPVLLGFFLAAPQVDDLLCSICIITSSLGFQVLLEDLRSSTLGILSRGSAVTSNEEASGMLPLLTVTGTLQAELHMLNKQIRQRIMDLNGFLDGQKQPGTVSSLVRLRLNRSEVGLGFANNSLHMPLVLF